MPSQVGIAVTSGPQKRGRGRPRKFADAGLPMLPRDLDDLYARIVAGNTRLSDAELEKFCGVTPAMVYALRDIAEGRVTQGAMATIEAFERMARYGHAPAKGGAKAVQPETQRQVVFVIKVGEPTTPAIQLPEVIDVTPEAKSPSVALVVNTSFSKSG